MSKIMWKSIRNLKHVTESQPREIWRVVAYLKSRFHKKINDFNLFRYFVFRQKYQIFSLTNYIQY